jgi:hypothetical protein
MMTNEEFILNLVVLKHNIQEFTCRKRGKLENTALEVANINPLTPELNPSAQRCLTRYFTGDFLLE